MAKHIDGDAAVFLTPKYWPLDVLGPRLSSSHQWTEKWNTKAKKINLKKIIVRRVEGGTTPGQLVHLHLHAQSLYNTFRSHRSTL